MSKYYDEWMHGLHLAASRFIQFVLLSLLLALVIWLCLLHWLWDCDRQCLGVSTLGLSFSSLPMHWRVIAGLCLAQGCTLTGWLFTWLVQRARLRRGDRHRRGARVVHDEHDE